MGSSLGLPEPLGAQKVRSRGADGPRTGSYGAMAARWIPDPKVGGSNPSSFILLFFLLKKKCKQKELPKLGIAPRLPRPQRGVLLLDYFGATAYGGSGYRSRFSTLRRLYATMYNNPPCASIGTRTRILSLEGINTTLVLWTLESCERSASSV